MNPQKWSDWLRQMNIFMVLDFYCQIAFQGGYISLQGRGSQFFFQGLFLKLLKRNQILDGARDPDNVWFMIISQKVLGEPASPKSQC